MALQKVGSFKLLQALFKPILNINLLIMKYIFWSLLLSLCSSLVLGQKLPVILDTDANNELDDQHARAYLLFNSDLFDLIGITVNGTKNGGDIKNHLAEAQRTVKLCGYEQKVPISGLPAFSNQTWGRHGFLFTPVGIF